MVVRDSIEMLTDSENGPRVVTVFYRDMSDDELGKLLLSGDAQAAMELLRRKDVPSMVAACYSAACRPPKSGGTGGSLPAGVMSAKPSKKVKVGFSKMITVHENVEDLAFPRHRPTAFSRRVQEAIDAEPVLKGRRSLREHREMIEKENEARKEAMLKSLIDDLENYHVGMEGNQMSVVLGGWTSQSASVAERNRALYEVQNGLRNGAHKKYLSDPDLRPPDDEVEFAMWKIADDIRKYIERARTDSSDLRQVYSHGVGTEVFIGGIDIQVRLRQRGPYQMTTAEKRYDPAITPEFEAASTRVGKVVFDELKSRVEVRRAESAATHQRAMERITEIVGTTQGSPNFSMEHGQLRVRVPLTDDQKKELQQLLDTSGVRFQDPKIQALYDRGRDTRVAFLEVMEEARTVGGVLFGTPQWKASNSTRPSHEVVIQGSARYPSTWIESSNDTGELVFSAGKGRGQYVPRESKIIHDSTTQTMVHEMGHRFEDTVPGLLQMEEIFWQRRTLGEPSKSLTSIFPGSKYGANEIARPDQFFDAYAGRDYKGVAYEVFTMGIEQTATAIYKTPIDDDHASFVLGTLLTLLPEG